MGTGDCRVIARGAETGLQFLTGWQDPAATRLHARTYPRSAVRGRFTLNCNKPVPGEPGVGEIDLCPERDVAKAISLCSRTYQNANRQLRRVTSTWCSNWALLVKSAANQCRRSDCTASRSLTPPFTASARRFPSGDRGQDPVFANPATWVASISHSCTSTTTLLSDPCH